MTVGTEERTSTKITATATVAPKPDLVTLALMEARSLLEKGWIQGKCVSPDGFCALGAINHVSSVHPDFDKRSVRMEMKNRLVEAMYPGAKVDESTKLITLWNDRAGRLKSQVLTAFDNAIARGRGV